MKLSVLFLFLTSLFANLNVFSAPTKITGKAPEYASSSIDFYFYHDFITEEKNKLGSIRFEPDGSFALNIDVQSTILAMADFDGYHGMLYIEPGKTYEIVFPPKRTQTEAQKRNPFIKPDSVWFGLKNVDKNELNYLIQQFEQQYSVLEDKYFDQIYGGQSRNLVDTIKSKLDQLFPKSNNQLFESHKFFRKANLDFALNQGKSKNFMESYFSTIKPINNLGAYAVIFNQTFSNYFEKQYTAANSKKFKETINAVNLHKLDTYFQESLHFNQQLSHLVILKSLSEAYYSKQFSKTSVLNLLSQVKQPEWSEFELKITKTIEEELTYLSSGTLTPTLILKNLDGKRINLAEFKNTYIYLHFTDPRNTICRQHLDALKNTANLYKEKITIINIISPIKDFKNTGNWPGIFTISETNIESSYKVKTFPTSFLIGKDGRLLLSPAPNPIDGLDRQIGQILKSDYMKDLQKTNNQQSK